MHSFAHRHNHSGEASAKVTKGLILKEGWRYDLHGWFLDTCLFRGKGRELRQRAITLADLQPGKTVLAMSAAVPERWQSMSSDT
jgi:hypothetical protein